MRTRRRPSALRRRTPALAAAVTAIAILAPAALRANETWDGGGADANFGTAANWGLNTLPANDGTAKLVFTGTLNTTPNVDAKWSVDAVNFASTTSTFTISGASPLTVGPGGITNSTTAIQGFTAPVATSASTTFNATGGTLSFNTVTLAAGSTLTFNAVSPQSAVALLAGSGSLTKTGTGGLTIGGTSPNSYTGTTTVNAGLLFLNKPAGASPAYGSAIPGPLVVNTGGTVRLNADSQINDAAPITLAGGALDLQTFTEGTTTTISMTGGSITGTGTGTLNLLANLVTNTSTVSSTITAAVNLFGGTRTFAVADGLVNVDLDISGAVTSGSLTKSGAGTLRLSGAASNTYAGLTTVDQGTLQLNKNAGLTAVAGDLLVTGSGAISATQSNQLGPNTNVTLSTSGVFAVGSAAFSSLSVFAGGGMGGGTYSLSSTATALTVGPGIGIPNPIKLTGATGGRVTLSDAGSSSMASLDLGNADRSVSIPSGGTLSLTGTVSNGALTFTGGGTAVLNPANTYAGGTTLSSGTTLRIAADDALGPSAAPLTFGATYSILDTTASFPLTHPLALAGQANLTPDAGTNLTLTGPISGSGQLHAAGPGTVTLAPSSTASFAGGVSASNSTVVIASDNALGSGTLSLFNATLNNLAAPRSFPNPVYIEFSSAVAGADLTLTGNVTLDYDRSLTVNNNTTLAGTLANTTNVFTGTLTKLGTGTLTFASGSTVDASAALSVNDGTVVFGPGVTVNASAVTNYATVDFASDAAATFNAPFTNYGALLLHPAAPFSPARGLTNFASISVPPNTTLSPSGVGTTNNGTLSLQGGTLGGTVLLNYGLLTGYGTLNLDGAAGLLNYAEISVPANVLTLTGTPSNFNYANIDVGPGAQFRLAVNLTSPGAITLDGGTLAAGGGTLIIPAGGVLSGRGVVATPLSASGTIAVPGPGTLNISSSFTNNGLVSLSSPGASLTGATITNAGTIQGTGTVANAVSNLAAGTVEAIGGTLALPGLTANAGLLAASAGNKLLVPGLASSAGTVSLAGGTLDTNAHPLTNAGSITGYGTLRASALTNTGTITLSGGTATVNAPLTNAPGGTVKVLYAPAVFTAPVTNNGTFTVTNTTATFAAGLSGTAPAAPAGLSFSGEPTAPTSSSALAGTLTVSPTALALVNYVRQDAVSSSGSVTIRPTSQGGDTSAIDTLTLSPGSSFDLADTRLILSSAATPIPTLRSYLFNSRLLSSTAANDPNHLLALGYVDNALLGATTWGGLAADASDLLLRLTYAGDANLDGVITPDDYALLDRGFSKHLSAWSDGDFNYDGTVNQQDYLLIDRTATLTAGSYSPGASLLATRESQFGPAYVAELIAAVPEPASLACLLVTLPLATRRSRRFRPHK